MSEDRDYHAGLEALQGDMAAHQRRFAGEVTAESNRALAAAEIEKLEKMEADAKPFVQAPLEPPKPIEKTVERRVIEDRKYVVAKGPEPGAEQVRLPTPGERWALEHMMPRVELLLTKTETGPLGQPSWCMRVMAVLELRSRVPGLRMIGMHAAADDLERRYALELFELLEDSNRVFGDWKSDPGKRIQVG